MSDIPSSEREERPFRFFDSREKYLLFANTCSEGREAARRIGREFAHLAPKPPALRLYKVGAGEGTILNMVLRQLHHRWPSVPLVAVIQEEAFDFIRLSLRSLVDRFREHPELVLVFTNLSHRQADLRDLPGEGAIQWHDVALEGSSSHGFEAQMQAAVNALDDRWSGDPAVPSARGCLVFYRADHRFALDQVIPAADRPALAYDLEIAVQPYRGRLDAATKVTGVLAPLASHLASGGRLIVIQACGGDPGLEIVQSLWPAEQPFATPRAELLAELAQHLGGAALPFAAGELRFIDPAEQPAADGGGADAAQFSYALQLNPDEVDNAIGTSTLLAGWNAATYVAEIDEPRLTEAMCHADYLEVTRRVLQQRQGLWFNDECFVVARAGD